MVPIGWCGSDSVYLVVLPLVIPMVGTFSLLLIPMGVVVWFRWFVERWFRWLVKDGSDCWLLCGDGSDVISMFVSFDVDVLPMPLVLIRNVVPIPNAPYIRHTYIP